MHIHPPPNTPFSLFSINLLQTLYETFCVRERLLRNNLGDRERGEKEATRRRTGLLPLRLFLISNGTGDVYEFGEEEGGK